MVEPRFKHPANLLFKVQAQVSLVDVSEAYSGAVRFFGWTITFH